MIVLARGSITNPDALAPHINDEMRVVEELKAEGIMKAVYRRAAGPGVYLLLEGPGIDAIRDRVDTLPFIVEGLMTLDYEEIYEI
jgi:muconolactone delta-isomerase